MGYRLDRVGGLVRDPPPYLCCGPAFRHHPLRRTDNILCRSFSAPVRRVFPADLMSFRAYNVRVYTSSASAARNSSVAVGSMSGLTDAGITAEQLAQMQGSGPGGGMTAQDAQNMKQKQQEQEGQRQDHTFDGSGGQAARASRSRTRCALTRRRLIRRRLLTCAQARKLEDMVLMAQRNQLQEALSDSQLKQMLEQISDGARRLPCISLPAMRTPHCCSTRSTQRSTYWRSLHAHAPLQGG